MDTFRALILSGVARYRVADYEAAEVTFQRSLLLAVGPSDQAAAYFWIGKCQSMRGDPEAAGQSWLQAATLDPTGYYSERARELSLGKPIFTSPAIIDMSYDLPAEKLKAEAWLRSTFTIAAEVNLEQPAELIYDPRYMRGQAFHSLGLYREAKTEFSNLYQEIKEDPIRTFRFTAGHVQPGILPVGDPGQPTDPQPGTPE